MSRPSSKGVTLTARDTLKHLFIQRGKKHFQGTKNLQNDVDLYREMSGSIMEPFGLALAPT
jgi:hypothetical protein